MQPLSEKSLPSLPSAVSRPTYDRSRVRPGIVHLGVGAFHRSHQAMYVDRLLEQGQAQEWGICGVGVLPSDRRMAEVMAAQDGLYTLVVKHADGTLEARVVGSIVEYLLAPDDPEAVIEKMAAESTRIVSLTVTEGGYNISPVTGEFDATAPDVVHDLQPGAAPRTTLRPGHRGAGPPAGARAGAVHRGVLRQHPVQRRRRPAQLRRLRRAARPRTSGPGSSGRCPSRTRWSTGSPRPPRTTTGPRSAGCSASTTGGRWSASPSRSGCSRTRFGLGRPPLEDAGVQVVDDVEPYELMKLRLLNASHQALAYFGHLAGYRLVHEAAQDPLFQRFLLGYMEEEATPTLRPVPGIDLGEYRADPDRPLLQPGHPGHAGAAGLRRLGADARSGCCPVIRENLAAGGEIRRSAAVVAGWARYCEGVDEQGQPIDVADRRRDRLMANARRQREDPLAFVADRDLFGDLVDDERFTSPYVATLASLHERGARATLEAVVDDVRPTASSSSAGTARRLTQAFAARRFSRAGTRGRPGPPG